MKRPLIPGLEYQQSMIGVLPNYTDAAIHTLPGILGIGMGSKNADGVVLWMVALSFCPQPNICQQYFFVASPSHLL